MCLAVGGTGEKKVDVGRSNHSFSGESMLEQGRGIMIGSDGRRMVVWGSGRREEGRSKRKDGCQWLMSFSGSLSNDGW